MARYDELVRLNQSLGTNQPCQRAVYRATRRQLLTPPQQFVLKVTEHATKTAKDVATTRFAIENPWHETELLRLLSKTRCRPYVVELMEDFTTSPEEDRYVQVLEFIPGGDLMDYLTQGGLPDKDDALSVFVKVVEAVNQVHANGIAHLDLKPENLLVVLKEKDGAAVDKKQASGQQQVAEIKLCDFGLARIIESPLYVKKDDDGKQKAIVMDNGGGAAQRGTYSYMAPEVFHASHPDEYNAYKADAWSLGCILFVLMTMQHPYAGVPSQRDNFRIQHLYNSRHAEFFQTHELPGPLSAQVQHLLVHLLCPEKQRWTVEDLFKEIRPGPKSPPTSPSSPMPELGLARPRVVPATSRQSLGPQSTPGRT